jgi:hypothetical protein
MQYSKFLALILLVSFSTVISAVGGKYGGPSVTNEI